VVGLQERFATLTLSSAITNRYAQIKAALRKKGRIVEDFDMLIAATALVHHCTVVTNNTDHFAPIEGLPTENWTQT
jgi:predicted nucleic acid-binding protein